MKRLHIHVAVNDFDAAVANYSYHLGLAPASLVAQRHADWRTEALHLSLDRVEDGRDHLKLALEDDPDDGYPITLRD